MREIKILLLGDITFTELFDGKLEDAEKRAAEIIQTGYLVKDSLLCKNHEHYYPPHRIKRIEIAKNETN